MNNRKISPYVYFLKDKEQREIVKKKLGNNPSFGIISKALSVKWNNLDDKDKEKYSNLSEKNKKQKNKTPYSTYSMDQNVKNQIYIELNKKENINKTFSKLLSENWRNLSDVEKTKYKEESIKYNEESKITRKKPRSAYIFFIIDKEIRDSVKNEYNTCDFIKISQILSKKWNEMTDIDKQPYIELSNNDYYISVDNKKERKRARTAYTFYMIDPEITETYKDKNMNAMEIMKRKSAYWHKLTELEKEKYVKLNLEEKQIFSNKLNVKKVKQTRSKSGYTLYSSDKCIRDKIKSDIDSCSFGEISIILSKQWKTLSLKDKSPYINKSNEDKERILKLKLENMPLKTRAKSPYLQFSTNTIIRNKAKEKNINISVIELAKILGKQWRTLSVKDKEKYYKSYNLEKEEIEKKLGK